MGKHATRAESCGPHNERLAIQPIGSRAIASHVDEIVRRYLQKVNIPSQTWANLLA